jgi:hypothetical protein
LQDRFAACKLVLHPEKTKIVYCKDANRRGNFANQRARVALDGAAGRGLAWLKSQSAGGSATCDGIRAIIAPSVGCRPHSGARLCGSRSKILSSVR